MILGREAHLDVMLGRRLLAFLGCVFTVLGGLEEFFRIVDLSDGRRDYLFIAHGTDLLCLDQRGEFGIERGKLARWALTPIRHNHFES